MRDRHLSGAETAHNRPACLTSFVGREQELAELERLWETCRLLTLTGPGGCGKTRLALELARRLEPRCPDGTHVVSLAPIADPGLVLTTVAEVLGLHRVTGESPVQTLTRGIGDRQMLLVLDNFEHLLGAGRMLPDLLAACSRLTVIVTSREILRLQAEQVYVTPPLTLPDCSNSPADGAEIVAVVSASEAGRLFLDRARATQSDFELDPSSASAVAKICRRLDGLPLAIELAAARTRLLTPEAIARRLGQRLPFLTNGPRDLPARQQTLRGTIAWSLDLLDDHERRLFRLLSVFAGGWTLEAAEAIRDGNSGSGDEILDTLASLVDKSLILRQVGPDDEPRFGVLETIREYGVEQLRAAGEEIAARRRHLSWFAALAERFQSGTFGPDAPLWLDRVAADLDNLRGALAWSLTDTLDSSAYAGLRLAGGLQQFWLFREHLAEGARWLEQVLAADAARGGAGRRDGDGSIPALRTGAHGTYPRVIALNSLSILLAALGRREESMDRANEALVHARRVHDLPGQAHALLGLARYLPSSEMPRILGLAEESVSIARSLGEPFATWRSLRSLGAALTSRGDYERARAALEESLAVARSNGYIWQTGVSVHDLGVLASLQGDLERATVLIEESLSWYATMGATRGRHAALKILGYIMLARGDADRASACFAESLALSYRAGDRPSLARSFEGLAATLVNGPGAASATSARRAALLLGAAAALQAVAGDFGTYARQLRVETEETIAAVCARLGDETFAAAWAEGQHLTLDRAYELGMAATSSLVLGAPPPDRTGRQAHLDDGGLTPREREIAALVATGRTNRQIADELVLSWRTVETHVHNILAKLELSTRAQIAVWAAERGLGTAGRQ